MVRWGLVPSEWSALNPKYTNHNAGSDKVLKTSWWRKPLEEVRLMWGRLKNICENKSTMRAKLTDVTFV